MKIKLCILAAAAFCQSVFAQSSFWPTYWEKAYYGKYSTYSSTNVGLWSLSGTTWNHYVFYGQSFACSRGATSCTQTFTQSVNFNWSLAVGVTASVQLIPEILNSSVAVTYTGGRSYTDSNSYSTTIGPGKKSQYAQYVPRQYGSANVTGARVATGRSRSVCLRTFIWCQQWGTEWEYYNDPFIRTAVLSGWKNTTSRPIHTFIVSNA